MAILAALRRLSATPARDVPAPESESRETLWDDAAGSRCPVCREAGAMRDGPRGGACVNIACIACGCRFNHTPRVRGWIEWTHGPSDPTPMKTKPYRFPKERRVALVRRMMDSSA